jgi:hypothetical protein
MRAYRQSQATSPTGGAAAVPGDATSDHANRAAKSIVNATINRPATNHRSPISLTSVIDKAGRSFFRQFGAVRTAVPHHCCQADASEQKNCQ